MPEKLRDGHDKGVLQLGQVGEHPAGQLAHLLLAEKGHGHFGQMAEQRLAKIGQAEFADRVEEERLKIGHDRLDQENGGHEAGNAKRFLVGCLLYTSAFPARKQQFLTDFSAWLKAHHHEDKPTPDAQAYAAPGISTAGWIPIKLPGSLVAAGLPAGGAVWLRREVTIPQDQITALQAINQTLRISLGPITGFESIYWNGELVWQLTLDKFHGTGLNHYFDIAATQYKEGTNTLAVRIFYPVVAPEFPSPPVIRNYPQDGLWLAKVEYALPPLDAAALASVPQAPASVPDPSLIAGFIFNGICLLYTSRCV